MSINFAGKGTGGESVLLHAEQVSWSDVAGQGIPQLCYKKGKQSLS